MSRPIFMSVSRCALEHNLESVRAYLNRYAINSGNRPPKICAVVKANAYGHGIEVAVQAFKKADGLAMLDLDDAVKCRELGWKKPILMLEGFFDLSEMKVFEQYQLTTVLHNYEQLNLLKVANLSQPLDIFLKLNSGMNRFGFSAIEYRKAFSDAMYLRSIGMVGQLGKMTHFSKAHEKDGISEQFKVFEEIASHFSGPESICNSAALLRFPDLTFSKNDLNWVRPGICLYGSSPFSSIRVDQFGFKRAMTLHSQIIAIQQIESNETVSYGNDFRSIEPMLIGIVACGYADGYPRHARTGTPVTVGGERTYLVGQVTMDALMVDLTNISTVSIGTPVILWGEGGPSVDEVANYSNTIGYDLLCSVTNRVNKKQVL